MKMLIDFFKVYWKELLDVFAIVVSIVLLCIKKKSIKVVDTLKEIIVRVLPSLICGAEATGLKGSDKMKWLIDELAKALRDLGYCDDIIDQYLPFATEQVELILCTPQKKGISK